MLSRQDLPDAVPAADYSISFCRPRGPWLPRWWTTYTSMLLRGSSPHDFAGRIRVLQMIDASFNPWTIVLIELPAKSSTLTVTLPADHAAGLCAEH